MKTREIIRDLIASMNYEILINSVVDNLDGSYTLSVSKTYWINNQIKVFIDGNQYKITEFVLDESLKVVNISAETPEEGQLIILSAPIFKRGTYKMIKSELNSTTRKGEIMPLIWLFEPLTERKTREYDTVIDRESNMTLYFIMEANTVNWLTEDHYINAIYPIREIIEAFEEKVQQNRFFTDEFETDETNLINLSESGKQENSIFDFNMTAIELKFFANIRKNLNCINNN